MQSRINRRTKDFILGQSIVKESYVALEQFSSMVISVRVPGKMASSMDFVGDLSQIIYPVFVGILYS